MYFQYLLITIWVTLTQGSSYSDLPEIIYEICPYSDICNKTASKSLNAKGFIPCCSSCKCDEKCGLRLDCCFDDLDKYRLKDNGIVACITPHTTHKTNSLFGAYLMIQTCKRETGDSIQTKSNIPCELYDKKDKSLVEPVSSVETGNIYVNEKCAICNNVYNFKKWNYLIPTPHLQLGPSVWETKNNRENHSELILYIPPEEEDWSKRRCTNKAQKTCDTNSTFDKLCHTLNVPYTSNLLNVFFRNPFCLLCKRQMVLSKKCKRDKERTEYRHGLFSVLIDYTVQASSKLRQNVIINNNLKPDCPTEASILSDLGTCVPIYCPDGMLMTPAGCKYFIRRWYIPSFTINFKLWPTLGNELAATTLNALTPDERKKPLLWMKVPCRQVKADAIEVYYEIAKNGQEMVESFIVRLWKLTPVGIDPSTMLPTLNKCLKYNWYINILGKRYAFRPTLDRYLTYIQDGQQKRVNPLTSATENDKRPKLYELIAIGPNSIKFGYVRPAVLIKTFFCEQITLPLDEIVALFGEILIVSKNVTLGDNEFAVNFFTTQNENGVNIKQLNKTTFSVCLEDYAPYYQLRAGSSKFSITLVLKQMIIFYTLSQFIS